MTIKRPYLSKTRQILTMLIALFAGVELAHAGSGDALGCLIEPNRIAEIGSPVVGVLESVLVERGDFVKKGQILARLTSGVERAAAAAAAARSRSEIEVGLAESNQDLAMRKHQRTIELQRQNFLSPQALDQVESELVLAKLKLTQARHDLKISEREYELTNAQLNQRFLRSPFSGYVMDRYLSPGERVEVKPVLRLAATDPLHVEVVLPVSLYGKIRIGMTAAVTPDFVDSQPRSAWVIRIDRFIDPASNSFRVRLELPNAHAELPSGLRCSIHWETPVAEPVKSRAPARAVPGLKGDTAYRPRSL